MNRNALVLLVVWLVALPSACGGFFGLYGLRTGAFFVVPGLGERIVTMTHCPNAVEVIRTETDAGPTSTRVGSARGHFVELTCVNADGTRKVVSNEEYALAAIGGSQAFACVGGVVVMLLPALALLWFSWRILRSG